MEELQAKHRKELKDLQARIAQKKKSATKKTRKGVNDECDTLERETKERQAAEVASLDGPSTTQPMDEPEPGPEPDALLDSTARLSLQDSNTVTQDPIHSPAATPEQNKQSTEDAGSAYRKKPNRAQARLARRAAEQEALFNQASQEASNLPDLKAQERERMVKEFKARGLVEKEIRADGHCLYSAFADQMEVLGLPLGTAPTAKPSVFQTMSNGFRKSSDAAENQMTGYKTVRKAAAEYIETHPDDFAPFLEEPLPEYIHKVRDTGEWGGQLELLALARSYGVHINVLQGNGRVEEMMPETVHGEEKNIWLAYYKHGFGLGEHYNSLRKVG